MTAQMYNSFIHHPSLFSSHQSKPTKSPASPFLSLQMSSVGARLRHCRREKGQILYVNFDFLEFCLSSALLMGQLKPSQKGGMPCVNKVMLNARMHDPTKKAKNKREINVYSGGKNLGIGRLESSATQIFYSQEEYSIPILIFYRITIVMRHCSEDNRKKMLISVTEYVAQMLRSDSLTVSLPCR